MTILPEYASVRRKILDVVRDTNARPGETIRASRIKLVLDRQGVRAEPLNNEIRSMVQDELLALAASPKYIGLTKKGFDTANDPTAYDDGDASRADVNWAK